MACSDPRGAGRAADAFVDPDHPGGELVGGLPGDGFFPIDDGSEAVFCIIGEGDGFVGVFDGRDANDRAEGLDGHDVHAVVTVVEDGGGDEVAVHGFVSEDNLGALGDGVLDLGDDMVFLFAHDHRADCGGFVVAVADREVFELLGEFADELGLDGVLDIEAFGGDADLAAVSDGVVDTELCGFVEVGALEYDHWVFGAEF